MDREKAELSHKGADAECAGVHGGQRAGRGAALPEPRAPLQSARQMRCSTGKLRSGGAAPKPTTGRGGES